MKELEYAEEVARGQMRMAAVRYEYSYWDGGDTSKLSRDLEAATKKWEAALIALNKARKGQAVE